MTIEIVAQSADDAVAAERAKADRLELVAALTLGGLTPSVGTMAETAARCRLPVVAMLRPRSGGFHYSSGEIATMAQDCERLIDTGAAGVVFGALDENGLIDYRANEKILRHASGVETVFHRAFDVLANPVEAVDLLVELGFRRILTSGGKDTALEGAETIREVLARAAGRIEVIVAGGIRANNVLDVVAQTGASQIHFAAQEWVEDRSTTKTQIAFNGAMHPESRYARVDERVVSEVRGLV